MATVHALLSKHNRDIRPGNTADIAMIIDGSAYLILDQVERLSLGAHLLARNRHTTAALRRSLD